MKKLFRRFAEWADRQRQAAIDAHLGRYQVELWINGQKLVSVPLTTAISYGRRGCSDQLSLPYQNPHYEIEFKLTVLKP